MGLTKLSRFDGPAALAPHAHGMRGTGHDVGIAERAGVDIGVASSVAKGIASSHKKHIQTVAGFLEAKKTLDGADVRAAMEQAERGVEIVLFIKGEDGEESFTHVRADDPQDLIPGQWVKI